jgi:hypothetical protein
LVAERVKERVSEDALAPPPPLPPPSVDGVESKSNESSEGGGLEAWRAGVVSCWCCNDEGLDGMGLIVEEGEDGKSETMDDRCDPGVAKEGCSRACRCRGESTAAATSSRDGPVTSCESLMSREEYLTSWEERDGGDGDDRSAAGVPGLKVDGSQELGVLARLEEVVRSPG